MNNIQFYWLEETKDIQIGGPGIIDEVDESKFGKRKYNVDYNVEGVLVLGLVERTPERKIVLKNS